MVSNAKRPECGKPRVELVGTSAGSLELHRPTCAGRVGEPKNEGWCNDLPISPIHNKGSVDEDEVSHSGLAQELHGLIWVWSGQFYRASMKQHNAL